MAVADWRVEVGEAGVRRSRTRSGKQEHPLAFSFSDGVLTKILLSTALFTSPHPPGPLEWPNYIAKKIQNGTFRGVGQRWGIAKRGAQFECTKRGTDRLAHRFPRAH